MSIMKILTGESMICKFINNNLSTISLFSVNICLNLVLIYLNMVLTPKDVWQHQDYIIYFPTQINSNLVQCLNSIILK